MAVMPDYRERGIGTKLVVAAVAALKLEGIPKVHSLVKRDNITAQNFLDACGFELRDELFDYSTR
jgi:ribosomal protein S18 acetylase RimI-like enzyme